VEPLTDAPPRQAPQVAPTSLRGYTFGMKTAISIPDDVFGEADQLARETKQSRSQLYTRAVREYVARHSSDSVTAALDALVVGESDSDFSTSIGRSVLERSEW
jgi:predicted transcriptional regulator